MVFNLKNMTILGYPKIGYGQQFEIEKVQFYKYKLNMQ